MIKGLVQGVGFRPFICRLAAKHGLLGEVDNRTDGVSVIVQGDLKTIDRFSNDLLQHAPPASQIKSILINETTIREYTDFKIAASKNLERRITEISPDIAVCHDCLEDLEKDPARISYPFTNCTNCGPRFTIIEALPYDRPNTSMKDFRMCDKCSREYNDILNRRFHAQPVACNSCGPVYNYRDAGESVSGLDEIIDKIISRIKSGNTVAVKGLGGYFLMCDALNGDAVKKLREKKNRDAKPFAVMFRDLTVVKKYCFLDPDEEKELTSWKRPILILKQKEPLAYEVGNGLGTTGAMLPYMPFHYLLFRSLDTPAVVLTSGNISDDPIITDDTEAEKRLKDIAGSILSYNRNIVNRADDSVVRIINRNTSILRRSRGFVPRPVDLKRNVEGILAVGAEQKNTFCIGRDNQAILSQHIGDLKTASTFDFLTESIKRFSSLFRFSPAVVACDLHPDYLSTRHAEAMEEKLGIQLVKVQHHHAHIASCLAESGLDEDVIGISLDGTGYGTDGCMWGGEFMVADLAGYERITHLDYVPMPGGDKAISEPWRMAFSFLYKYFGDEPDYLSIPLFRSVEKDKLKGIREMIVRKVNSPLTSGAGRLFDAVSALLGLCAYETFDAEAPMRLESAIEGRTDEYYPFSVSDAVTFRETFKAILDDLSVTSPSVISAKFHNTIAQIILQVSGNIRSERSLNKVVLSGGVFQNKYLLEKTDVLLKHDGFMVFTNNQVPANDGGISLGQLAVASKRIR